MKELRLSARVCAVSVLAGVLTASAPSAAATGRLAITTAPQTVAAGVCSSAVTVQRLSSTGAAALLPSAAKVSLSGSGSGLSLSFFSNSACTAAISAVTIPANHSNVSFHFKASGATTYSLGAASSGLTATTQKEVVIAGAAATLAFDSNPPGTIASGATISPALDLRIEDLYGNPVNSSAPITLSLAAGTGSLTGTTKMNASGGRALFSQVSVVTATTGSFVLQATSAGVAPAKGSSFTVKATVAPSPTPTPTPSPSGQVVQVSLNGIEQPTPEKDYLLPLAASLSVSVAQNETTGRVLRVAVPNCQALSVNAPSGVAVTLFHMPQFTTTTPSFIGAITGVHYDPLVPISTTSNQICRTETWVWADIEVATGTAPGAYSFSIGDLPVSLKVLNFTMPAQPTMPLYMGLDTFTVLAGHYLSPDSSTSVQGPLAMAYVDALRAHRIEPEGQRIADPSANSTGSLNLDNWSSSDSSFRETEMTGALGQVCAIAPGSIAGGWLSAATLKEWQATLLIEPGLANAWAYITDEPDPTDSGAANYDPNYAGTIARAQLVRANAPGMKIMVTSEPATSLLGLIDHFTVVFEYFMQPGHWQNYAQAPGYWIYGACMSHGSCGNGSQGAPTGAPDLMLDQNDVHGRLFPLVAYALGGSAALYYDANYDYGVTNAWTNQYQFGGNGDGQLFYPGAANPAAGTNQLGYTFATDTAVTSIRLKAIRQGQYDIEYVNLAAKNGLSTNLSTLVPNQFRWSRNNPDYDAMREAIISALGL